MDQTRRKAAEGSPGQAPAVVCPGNLRIVSLAILQLSTCVVLALLYLIDPRQPFRWVLWFLALPAFLVGSVVVSYRLFRRTEKVTADTPVSNNWIGWIPWLFVMVSAMAVALARLSVVYAVAWCGSAFVAVAFAIARQSAVWKRQEIGPKYLPPRWALFHTAFSGMATVRSGTPLGAVSFLSGLVGAALIVTQILVFIASWLTVEVVGPILNQVVSGPFLWFGRLLSPTRRPVLRLGIAVLWTAIGAAPGLALAFVTARILQR
jgi:hypothetical protein